MHRAYLDHAATTPLDARVLETMIEVERRITGNPSSLHSWGREARRAVEDARRRVAEILTVEPKEIVFTGSATEANNLAIFGLAAARPDKPRIAASPIEHPSVAAALTELESDGRSLVPLEVSADGVVDPQSVTIDGSFALCSVMKVNNETGVIQDFDALAAACREFDVPFHSDIVQAAGKIAVAEFMSQLDAATLSGHKFNGPRGVGCLFVRKETRLASRVVGGGQERELRAGTENVAAIVGFAHALDLATSELERRRARLTALEMLLFDALGRTDLEVRLNSGDARRVPGTMSLRLPGESGDSLLMKLDLRGVAVSQGSACSSGSLDPSRVLDAMGLSITDNLSSIRVSFGATSTEADVEAFVAALVAMSAS